MHTADEREVIVYQAFLGKYYWGVNTCRNISIAYTNIPEKRTAVHRLHTQSIRPAPMYIMCPRVICVYSLINAATNVLCKYRTFCFCLRLELLMCYTVLLWWHHIKWHLSSCFVQGVIFTKVADQDSNTKVLWSVRIPQSYFHRCLFNVCTSVVCAWSGFAEVKN